MSRKLICLVLAVCMVMGLALTGCKSGDSDATTAAASSAAATSAAASAEATTAAGSSAADTTAAPAASGWDTGSIEVEPLGIDLEGAELEYSCSIGLNDARNVVWEKAGQYTSEVYNGTVKYTLVDSAEYNSKIMTLSASGMSPDAFYTGGSMFTELVSGEAIIDLTDYIPLYMSRMYAKVSENHYQSVTYNGRIYGMIPFKDLVSNHSLLYDGSQVEAAGLEVPDWKSYTDLKEFLYQMREWMDGQGREDDVVASLFPEFWRDANLENIGSNQACVSAAYEDVTYIKDVTPYTQLFNPYVRDNFDKDSVLRRSGAYIFWWSQGYIFPPDTSTDYKCYLKKQAISLGYTGYSNAMVNVVSSNSEVPEAACKLIEILDNDKYLGTIMRFGEEGVHWTMTADGQADCTLGTESKIKYWYGAHLGDITNCVLPTDVQPNFHDVVAEIDASAIFSGNMGFAVDATPVEAEIAALKSTYSEYLSATNLYSGMLTEEQTVATIDEMIEKLKGNGSETVLAEFQKQLDEWYAAKG